MSYFAPLKNCRDFMASSTLSASISQYGVSGKKQMDIMDKSKGMVASPAMVLQWQKWPRIQHNDAPDVIEYPMMLLNVGLKSG